MLSRRAFLLGGAASVAAAGVGAQVIGPARILHRVGLRSSPDHHVPPSGWPVDEGTVASNHLPRPAAWAMARPAGEAALLGALVCLHGRGNDHRFAFDAVHVHDVVAAAGLRIGVAAVDGGAERYWHARNDGTDAGRMVLDDFLPLVQARMGVDRVAIMGWSMGGYGALHLAQEAPSRFRAVVASSPALWQHARETAPGSFDDAGDFARHDVFAHHDGIDPRRTRIDCGADDPFAPAARAFAERLGPITTSSFPAGYHDAAFWRWIAPRQIAFVGDRLSS